MTHPPLLEQLAGVVAPAVEPLGVVFWGVELASSGGRMVVRIYIDNATENGPDVDLCADVSRELGVVLDAEPDLLPGAYVLEVSSPGLTRRFFTAEQMAAFVGRPVDVRLKELFAGRRHLRGALVSAAPEAVVVDEAGKRTSVPWAVVKTARLVHEFPGGAN